MSQQKTMYEWDAFTADCNDKLSDLKSHIDAVLNDPESTAAERVQALQDYMKQEYFVNWINQQNESIQDTGVIPATMSIPSISGMDAGLWSDGNDLKTGYLLPIPIITDNVIIHDASPSATQEYEFTVAMLDGIPIILTFHFQYNGTLPPDANIYGRLYQDLETDAGTGIQYHNWQAAFAASVNADGYQCYYRFGSETSYKTEYYIGYNGTNNGAHWRVFPPSNIYPVHTDFTNLCENGTWNQNIPVASADQCLFTVLTSSDFSGGSVNPDAPWDFFNDTIYPAVDPDNRLFDEPYTPAPPDKPEPEEPEFPGETENTGVDIENNDISGVGGSFGFMTQYALRGSDIEKLGSELWRGFDSTDPDVLDYINNFTYLVSTDTGSVNMADIMDFFVSLKMYPFPLGNVHTLSDAGNSLYIGAGTKPIPMTNNIHTMDSYVGELSAGSCHIPFWFGDYRDYMCEIELYLPYCGTVQLDPADVMGGTLECFYAVDFCTGGCTAYVNCLSWDGLLFPVAALPGQIAADVPMTATNAGRIASRVLSDRIAVVENIVSAAKFATTGTGAALRGNIAAALRSGISAFMDPALGEQRNLAEMGSRGAVAAPVLGSGGGFTSFAGQKTVHIQIRSPKYPESYDTGLMDMYAKSVGNPAVKSVKIGDCSGFCQFANVDVSSITTDAADQIAIRTALENGVYI